MDLFQTDAYDPFQVSTEVSGKIYRSACPTVTRIQALLLPLLHRNADFDGLLFRHVGCQREDGAYKLEGTVKRLTLVLDQGKLQDFIFHV